MAFQFREHGFSRSLVVRMETAENILLLASPDRSLGLGIQQERPPKRRYTPRPSSSSSSRSWARLLLSTLDSSFLLPGDVYPPFRCNIFLFFQFLGSNLFGCLLTLQIIVPCCPQCPEERGDDAEKLELCGSTAAIVLVSIYKDAIS